MQPRQVGAGVTRPQEGARRVTPDPTPYRPAWWVPGAHLQTLWGKLLRRLPRIPTRHERWETPDGDFLDLHRLPGAPGAPRLLILHGLEGSHRSHYAVGLLDQARRHGWTADVLVWRSCGDEMNRAARSYHSGETTDLDFVVDRLTSESPRTPLVAAGVSLGGNVLLKWLGERGSELPTPLRAAAAISVPFDLARGARHIDRGFSRVYQAHFLRSLRRKARLKGERFPGLFSTDALAAARSLWAFDDAVTAPLHGFRDARDYYERSSSIRYLSTVRLPTLLLSAVDDPFLPAEVLDEVRAIASTNSALHLEFLTRGGHAGFVSGTRPWRPRYYAEERAAHFLAGSLAGSLGPTHAAAPRPLPLSRARSASTTRHDVHPGRVAVAAGHRPDERRADAADTQPGASISEL